MSIINKMLRDLDERNGRPGGEAIAGDAIRSVKPVSPWHLGPNTLRVSVGLVAAGLAGGWWMQQQRNSVYEGSPTIVSAPPVPILVKSPPPVTSPAALPATVPVAAIEASPAATVDKASMPAPPQAPASAPIALAMSHVAITSPNVVAPTAPSPAPSAKASGTHDSGEMPPPPVTASPAPKAAGGKSYSPKQVSANLLAEAVLLDRQGRQEEAKAPLERLLAANPLDGEARRMLVQLQLDTGNVEQARSLLVEGQRLNPDQSNFTLALARLKVDGGDVGGAIELLEAGRASARNEPQYHALLAALLLGTQRYDEAAQHYLVALRSDPANGTWLLGAGVAFEGVGKLADAAEAYRRADGAANLTPEMANFLSERLARLAR
jgi:MSHA biogenesis protein MshN